MLTGQQQSRALVPIAPARGVASNACALAADAPFSLLVDLSLEPMGQRWARGVATLALLCGAALALAPGIGSLATAGMTPTVPAQQFQMNPMLLPADDAQAPPAETSEAAFDPEIQARPVVASTAAAVRVQGPVTEGLYWSLRSAGISPAAAADYLHALSTRIDVGADVAPFDRFDLVLARSAGQPLLYAALHRVDGPDVELMKWNSAGRTDWFDTEASGAERSAGLMAPVAGRITSNFGVRYHPILHFARMHAGIDFGAAWGSPIVAAADGQVVGAGWTGGYGRQVRIAHASGIVTSYSHMSGFSASVGDMVRQGQVIGFVGSTGLSTGPHLHFEVKVNGRAVDPMQVRMQSRNVIGGAERQAFNARLKQLLSIGRKAA